MLTSLLGDCAVCNHTNWCPTTQEFIDQPKLPTVHLCALGALPERTPFLRYNCQRQQWHDSQGAQKHHSLPTPGRKAIPPPFKTACNPKTQGDCPRFQTVIAVGNVRLPVAPLCSTALWLPFCDRQPRVNWVPSWCDPLLRLAGKVQTCCFGRQQERDDDQATRQGDNLTPDHWQ
jgi:hypothetical protein